MIKLLLDNKHTSIAGLVYLGAKVLAQLGAVWWPEHKDQFTATANIIEGVAVSYGLLAAGDASQSQKVEGGKDQSAASAAAPKP